MGKCQNKALDLASTGLLPPPLIPLISFLSWQLPNSNLSRGAHEHGYGDPLLQRQSGRRGQLGLSSDIPLSFYKGRLVL
jgi:hypothetical protein